MARSSPFRFLAASLTATWLLLATFYAAADDPKPTEPPRSASRDEAAIRALAEAWRTHYNAGDANQVAELYAEDAYYLSAHVLAHGRDQIRAYWQRGIAAGGHIDWIEPLLVHHSGSLGYAVGRYQATNAGVTVDGRILIVVKKSKGKWRMAAHETVVRDQP
jgi:ketosteroid isomerase-like protein